MESSGRTWEGYEWVDGWPVSPLRQQQQQPNEPAYVQEGEGGMVVEPAEPAKPATAATIVTASVPANIALLADTNTGDSASGRHSVTTEQVNDFLSSYAGSNCGSEEDSEDEVPDECGGSELMIALGLHDV